MNILFLGGGRRVELAKRFIDRGHLLCFYEKSLLVPISEYTFTINGKDWKDPDIKENILYIAEQWRTDLIIPLQDEAVVVASLINNYKLPCLTPGYSVACTCFDKQLFQQFMQNNFKQYYPTFSSNKPVVIKPRFGFGSKDIKIRQTLVDYNYETEVVQRYLQGKEYSVDAYFSRYSHYIDSVPRERLRVAGGEVISSVTVEFPLLQSIVKVIGEKLKLVGPTNFQFIVEEDKPYLIEINSRFGGGSTLSMEAGLNMIDLIENDYDNKRNVYFANKWKRNLFLERSYRDHFYYE